MDNEKKYREKYKKLVRDLDQAIQEGTVYTNEFRERVQEEKKELDGDSQVDYLTEGPDLITPN